MTHDMSNVIMADFKSGEWISSQQFDAAMQEATLRTERVYKHPSVTSLGSRAVLSVVTNQDLDTPPDDAA